MEKKHDSFSYVIILMKYKLIFFIYTAVIIREKKVNFSILVRFYYNTGNCISKEPIFDNYFKLKKIKFL